MRKPKKRRMIKIKDEDLLAWIKSGDIVVDLQTAQVHHRGVLRAATIIGRDGHNGTRYRYEFRCWGIRRTIVRSRLVYMAGTRKLIPWGFEIHHLDGDRYNDCFENLIMVTKDDHLKIHARERDAGVPF